VTALHLASLVLIGITILEGPSHHVQGIDVDETTLWVSAVDREGRRGLVSRHDVTTGKRLSSVDVHDGPRYHPGGLQVDGGVLWLPVAEYRRASTSWIQKRDKTTLALISQFEVADHIGCVAVAGGVIWGGNWDATHLYRWRLDGTLIDKRENPTGTRYQDLKFEGGLLIGSGLGGPEKGRIDWLDPETLAVKRRIVTGVTDRGVAYTHEGMAVRDGVLYLLPEDEPSRLFRFKLP
jgi:hypothetical protein